MLLTLPRRRPSAATVIALIALFVALGGPAEAARMIHGKNIKKNSVSGNRIKKGTLPGAALRQGTVALDRLARRTISELQRTPAGEVDVQKIADGAVNTNKVADKSLRASDIADDQITAAHIPKGALTGDEIAENSIDSTEIIDGRLFGADIGSFLGKAEFDFGTIAGGSCAEATAAAREVPPSGTNARDLTDDVILVTPEDDFPVNRVSFFARAATTTTIGIVACNHSGSPLALGTKWFRYITIDTDS